MHATQCGGWQFVDCCPDNGNTVQWVYRSNHASAPRRRLLVTAAHGSTGELGSVSGRELECCHCSRRMRAIRKPAAHSVTTAVLLLLLGFASFPVSGALWPVRLWGELGYDYRLERFGDAQVDDNVGRLRVNAATFIVRPWIAQLQGGLGVVLRKSDSDASDTTGDLLSGDATLRLFPLSPFPFQAFFETIDNTQDTDLRLFNTDRTRYGFEQRYTTPKAGAFLLRYEHNTFTTRFEEEGEVADVQEDISDLWRFRWGRSFGRHSLETETNWDRIDRNETREDNDRLFSIVRHTFRPDPTWSVQNRLTLDKDTFERQTSDFTTTRWEFNNFTLWRPRTEKSLVVNGLLRAFISETDTERDTASFDSTTANVGASYDWSPRWRFSGNASLTHTGRDDGDSQTRTFQRVGADYTAPTVKLGGFDYSWFAGPEVSNLSDEEGSVQSVGVDIGHTFNRVTPLSAGSNLTFNARQSVGLVEDTDGRSVQKLLHSGSVAWNRRSGGRSQFVRLSASDNRTFGGGGRLGNEESEFQIITLNAQLDQRLTAFSSLTGSASVQATRTARGPADDAPGLTSRVKEDFKPAASVNITYTNQRLFDIRRLRFRSSLRLLSDSYVPFLDDPVGPAEREQAIWENRLDYSIGRLELRLVGTLSKANVQDRILVLLQVRRFFGDF